MPINPFAHPTNFAVPTFDMGNARAPDSTWSNIASLGESIGKVRERNTLGEILKGAVDANGNIDLNKAATAIALSGRDPQEYLKALTERQGLARAEAAQKALEAHYLATQTEAERAHREAERLRQEELKKPTIHIQEGGALRPPTVYRVSPDPSVAPSATPLVVPPAAPAPAPAIAPGTSGALGPEEMPPGPNLALSGSPPPPGPMPARPGAIPLAPVSPGNPLGPPPIGPGGPPGQRIGEQMPLPFDPETAAPYQVAGEPVPGPKPPTAAKITPETKFNEKALDKYSPSQRELVKGIATYQIDPDKYSPKDREDLIGAALEYRPDYNTAEYQKRAANPPSAEIQARMSLGQLFITRLPQIKERIMAGEYTDPQSKMLAAVGQGGPGELRRAIDEGADGVTRMLTGAGMPATEAATYARRYQFSVMDTKESALRKANELESVLRYLITGVGQGRGGKDMLEGFQDQFGKPVLPEKAKAPQVKSDAEVNDLVSQATKQLAAAPSPEARAKALPRVHDILKQRGVPPQFWPR